jgi:hypothetical protein
MRPLRLASPRVLDGNVAPLEIGSMWSKAAVCNVTETISNSPALCAVSIGSDPSLPEAVSIINEAPSLKPYAPVDIHGAH